MAKSEKKKLTIKSISTPASPKRFRVKQERMIAALQAANMGMWEWDLKTNKVIWSDLTLELFGMTSYEEYISRIHPDDLEHVNTTINVYLQAPEKSYFLQHRLILPNGEIRWLQASGSAIKNKKGKATKLTGTVQDFTESKRTEEALRESEQRFRTLQEASNGGIAIHDQGIIIDANQGLSRLMGYPLEELIGMNGIMLLPAEEREMVMSKIKSGYELPYDSQGLRKDGTRFDMEIRGSNVPYKGKMVRITEFRDVSDRKQAEEQIREQNARLEAIAQSLRRKNEQLEEFTQIVSHNLRAPVGNINSLIGLLENSGKPEDFAQITALLKQSGQSLFTTLNELNEVLQIKQNKHIEKQEIVFDEVFVKVKNMLIAHIKEINASVTSDFSHAPGMLYPNIYLESILLNLLSNALKYHSPQREALIHFKTYKEGGTTVLEAIDNGLGINLEKHGHQIFKLHKTFHKHAESKGIGLFMIKNQIETMGGEIEVKSSEDEGTTFTIRFTKNESKE